MLSFIQNIKKKIKRRKKNNKQNFLIIIRFNSLDDFNFYFDDNLDSHKGF